jgi:hypothetical protein
MSDFAIALLIPVVISIFCWWMVLKPKARRKFSEPGYRFWPLNREERESFADGLSIATSLIGALFFTFVSIIMIAAAIYRWMTQ